MDVLGTLFDEMYLSGEVVARFDLSGDWGITMPPRGGIFHAVDKGECWVRVEVDGSLFQVSEGDLLIFPEGAAHDILYSPSSTAVTLQQALVGQSEDSFLCTIRGPGPRNIRASFICGVFHFRDGGFHAFRSMLPPVLMIRGGKDPGNWVRASLKRLSDEAASITPGAHTVISRLTDILLIEGVRHWLHSETGDSLGLLRGLHDPATSAALECIHSHPERPWTVESLADEVSLSRSSFAAHFAGVMGMPPLQYVTGWRMQLAKNWLHGSSLGLAEISERLGYASEDAFKRAFRREVGVPPGTYRKESRGQTEP
jgi:AraC-like DNA-binding protein